MDWFANGLLHEVKNIMQNSSGMAQVLKKRLKLEGPDGDGLDVIRYEQDTASRLLAEYCPGRHRLPCQANGQSNADCTAKT